jgi:hypothetical protein
MFSKATAFFGAGLWAVSAFGQNQPAIKVEAIHPGMNTAVDRAMRKLMENPSVAGGRFLVSPRDIAPPVCSIPLVEVPVDPNVEAMPVFRPPANAPDMDRIQTTVPAPPCNEHKEQTR